MAKQETKQNTGSYQPAGSAGPNPTTPPTPPSNPSSTGKIVLIIVAVLVLLALLIGGIIAAVLLSRDKDSDDQPTRTEETVQTTEADEEAMDDSIDTPTSTDNNYPEVVKQNFMTACTGAGGTDNACSCALEYIEQRVSYNDFVTADAQYRRDGTMPEEYKTIQDEAIANCARHQVE